jgi:hypothetical protein
MHKLMSDDLADAIRMSEREFYKYRMMSLRDIAEQIDREFAHYQAEWPPAWLQWLQPDAMDETGPNLASIEAR